MNINKKIKLFFLLLFLFTLVNCSKENRGNCVSITRDNCEIKLTILNDKIIHVVKSRDGIEVAALPDYVTSIHPENVEYLVNEKNGVTVVETKSVKIEVDADGQVAFYDLKGKKLTKEIGDHSYITTDSNLHHKVSQAFEAGDEALYGLGQYQSGIMNWKNVPLRMSQYNQEVAVPFLVSTNNYGIYWHNYSVTDFNYPENKFEFKGSNTNDTKIVKFTPKKSGEYTFMVDNGVQVPSRRYSEVVLSINQDTVINYNTCWMPDVYAGRKVLEAGKTYEIAYKNFNNKNPEATSTVLYNEPDFNRSVFRSTYGSKIDYYFIYGDNPSSIISEYSNLTGKAPMFDRSVFGFWQCREKYATQDELLTNAREMKRRQIPLDYIVQDWDYWPKDMRGPEWDRSRYPNPTEMLKELDNLDIKLMVSVWPSFTNEPLLKKYGLDAKKMGEGNNFLDFYDSEVPDKFYRMLSDSMFHIGVTSIWLDGTEPESKPIDSTITGAGEFGAVANPYSLLVVKSMYEGKRKEFPNERVFNLTRSSYAGQQRYGVTTWSGDVEASWEQFSEQIPAGLNLMMAGIPYWTTDIGGFFRDITSLNKTYDNQYTNKEYIELLTRWFQFGTFNPIFRLHGFKSNTEIWNYTPEFEAIARKFIDIRYQLIPYIYSASWNVTKNGQLMMSPLVYQYPDDKTTWAIKDQFMLGESMLVNPVIEYKARSRKLYLPKGEWYDYWTNELIEGGRWIEAKAELENLPLYVKAGSIIPMSEKVQHSSQQLGKPITLKIYPNKDVDYTLYVDDTESYNYEKGEYSEIEIKYNNASKSVTICTPTNVEYFKKEIGSIDFNIEVVGVDSQIKSVKFIGDEVLEKI